MIGQIVSRYRLLKPLGEGGMGVVYLAEHTTLGRRVAIKFLTATDEHYRGRFLREARALSSFSHANIAAVYDYGETDDGRPYIVMELINGPTLDEVLRRDGLTLGQAIDVAIAVGEALVEAHRHGIVHRDIKPGNVMFNERSEVKVVDFGLAKQIHAESATAGLGAATQTQSNVMVGTPLYLSPEQAGNKPVDERSDLFALGALLYECITGRSAFSGDTVIEIGAQVIHFNPPPPSKINSRVPAALDRITMKALEKKPAVRYQSALEMIQDLRAFRAKLSRDSQPIRRLVVGTETSTLRPQRTSALGAITETIRRPRLSIGSVIIGLTVLALAGWAAIHFSRSVAHVPPASALEAYDKGSEALRNGAYLQAARLFEQAIAIDDKFALAHARLAETWIELDYTDRARDQQLRVSTLVPDRSVYPKKDALYLSAVTATIAHEFPLAVESYRQIVGLAPDRPEVYADLGHAYEKNDEPKKAIETYTLATSRGPQYATAFLRLGYLYGRQENLSGAEAAFSKAETLYEDQQNNEGHAEVYYQRGQLYNQLNKLPEARQQLQRALASSVATGNEYLRIRTLLQLSGVANTEGNRAQAEGLANEAIALAQTNGMETLIANGFNDLGNVFLTHGDYGAAEKHFGQALDYARQHNLRRAAARALLSLGSSRLEHFGDPDQALIYAGQALPFFQQGNYRKEISQALVILQRADALKGNYDQALKAAEQQLQLAEQLGDPSQLALAHSEVGVLLIQKEQYAQALPHFMKYYEINKSLGHQLGVGFALVNRGNAQWLLGDYSGARAAFGEAMPIASGGEDKFKGLLAWLEVTSARMDLSGEQMPDARTMSDLNLLAEVKDSSRAAEAKTVMGLAQSLAGKKIDATQSCAAAFAIATHLNNQELLGSTQLILAQTQLDQGKAHDSIASALHAQENLSRLGKHESEWKAWLIAARASRLLANPAQAREYASHASGVLSSLEQIWDSESYRSYLTRPDIRRYHNQLKELLSSESK